MKLNTRLLLLAISLSLLSPALAETKIYKWVDEQGNVHYGERPPVQQKKGATEMNLPKGPPPAPKPATAGPAGEPTPSFLESRAKEREEKAQAEERAAKEQALREKNCEQARKNLASQQFGGRRYVVGKDGERQYLTAEESQQRLEQAQRDVAEWCD